MSLFYMQFSQSAGAALSDHIVAPNRFEAVCALLSGGQTGYTVGPVKQMLDPTGLYCIDFLCDRGGWYTYDIDGSSVFDAACELLSGGKTGFSISKIQQVRP